ncbi:MAG TPA: phage holin family protein [Solirubrobacteraceae bacterium]|nr:phage holin family protein [Solirubrobacteraceae bacterium]
MATEQEDPRTKELVQALSEQTSTLLRKELALAQLELKEKGKQAGIGGGMIGGGGLLALYGLGALFAAIIMLLGTAMATWLSALIVAVVLFAVAGGLALTGKKEVQRAGPAKPEQAVATTTQDVRHVRERAKEGRHG